VQRVLRWPPKHQHRSGAPGRHSGARTWSQEPARGGGGHSDIAGGASSRPGGGGEPRRLSDRIAGRRAVANSAYRTGPGARERAAFGAVSTDSMALVIGSAPPSCLPLTMSAAAYHMNPDPIRVARHIPRADWEPPPQPPPPCRPPAHFPANPTLAAPVAAPTRRTSKGRRCPRRLHPPPPRPAAPRG
jgi:hypothetical protein